MIQIIKYILMLNATRFKDNRIGLREALLSIRWLGKDEYLHRLRKMYNEHFHYDEETL